MCSVLCSIGSVLNANCKIHCFGEPAIYFPKSFLRRNFHLNPTFSSPPRLFSHKYSFGNEVVFEYRNHRRPTFPLFSFVLFFFFYLNSLKETISQLFYFPILTFIFSSTTTSISKLKDFHSFGQPFQLIGEPALLNSEEVLAPQVLWKSYNSLRGIQSPIHHP